MRCFQIAPLLAIVALACGPSAPDTQSASISRVVPQTNAAETTKEAPAPGPLLWAIETPTGLTSHILATGEDVSSRQLIPEVWQRFEESTELVLEMDTTSILVWLMAKEPWLAEAVGNAGFEELLLRFPDVPKEALTRMPVPILTQHLATPGRHPGPSNNEAFLARAKELDKSVRFLVPDTGHYLDAFFDGKPDLDELRKALANPKPAIKARRSLQLAYLRGDIEAIDPEAHHSPQYMKVIAEQNRPWISTLEKAFAKGKAFAIISETDLLSDQGMLVELKKRGYKISRALKGHPSSLNLDTPQFLRQSECKKALLHIFKISAQDAAERLEDPAVFRTFLLTDVGRNLMSLCLKQSTPWFDCVTDATNSESIPKCDQRHPIPQ